MKMKVTKDIAAEPDVVFSRILDIPGWADRISGIEKVEMLTEGPVQVGTRFRETRIMMGKQATEEMTVAEIDAPRHLLLTAESHGTRYRTSHTCEPIPSGTRVSLDFEGTPVKLSAKLMSPLCVVFAPMLKKCVEGDLEDLRQAIEGDAAGTQFGADSLPA